MLTQWKESQNAEKLTFKSDNKTKNKTKDEARNKPKDEFSKGRYD